MGTVSREKEATVHLGQPGLLGARDTESSEGLWSRAHHVSQTTNSARPSLQFLPGSGFFMIKQSACPFQPHKAVVYLVLFVHRSSLLEVATGW